MRKEDYTSSVTSSNNNITLNNQKDTFVDQFVNWFRKNCHTSWRSVRKECNISLQKHCTRIRKANDHASSYQKLNCKEGSIKYFCCTIVFKNMTPRLTILEPKINARSIQSNRK